MRERLRTRWVAGAALALSLVSAAPAAAQLATIMGHVKDAGGNPIEGAVVVGENPEALPSKVRTTTKKNGDFALVGLRSGNWMVTVTAPGFQPVQRPTRATSKGGALMVVTLTSGGAAGVLDGITTAELKAELAAATTFYNNKQYPEALSAFEALQKKAPTVSAIGLQIASIHRQMKTYDKAIAAYDEVLVREPANAQAQTQRAMTYLEKGDLDAADTALTEQAKSPGATAEVYYGLAEVKFAKAQADQAAVWYEKAASANPSWGKPLFKLGLVALNKGDNAGAKLRMQKVIDVDPSSAEAAEAKLILKQLP